MSATNLAGTVSGIQSLTNSEIEVSLEVFRGKLDSQEFSTNLEAEFKFKLGEATRSTVSSFANINHLFRDIRTSGVPNNIQWELTKLSMDWERHNAAYVDIVRKSAIVAVHAQSAADEFSSIMLRFLKDDHISLEQKIREIQAYVQKLERREADSRVDSDSLEHLKKSIKIFWKAQEAPLGGTDAHHVATLDKSIGDLEAQIKEHNGKVIKIVNETKLFTILPNVIALASWLPVPFMVAVYDSLKTSAAAEYIREEIQAHEDMTKSLEELRQKREKYTPKWRESAFAQVFDEVIKSEGDFFVFCDKVSTLTSVLRTIRADLQAINEQLIDGTPAENKVLFKARIDTTARVYATMSDILYQCIYALNLE